MQRLKTVGSVPETCELFEDPHLVYSPAVPRRQLVQGSGSTQLIQHLDALGEAFQAGQLHAVQLPGDQAPAL